MEDGRKWKFKPMFLKEGGKEETFAKENREMQCIRKNGIDAFFELLKLFFCRRVKRGRAEE
jgi:hypothetical protein